VGQLQGNPVKLMEKYFDAFVYVANWGTREFMLRIPAHLCDLKVMQSYLSGSAVTVAKKNDKLIVQCLTEDEPEDWDAGDSWMASLMPLRAELMQGDFRCLYLAWLLAAQSGELEDEELEPAVPPGLHSLSAALQSFADFMRIDPDLIEAAAIESSPVTDNASSKLDLQAWISALAESEKNAALLEMLQEDNPLFRMELLRRFHTDISHGLGGQPQARTLRTVEALLSAAQGITAERQRRAAARRAAEEARKKQEEAAARAKHFEQLKGREPALWQRVGDLVQTSKPREYDLAIAILADLRDLAVLTGQTEEFNSRFSQLRQRYSTRPSFQQRLITAGFGKPQAQGQSSS
jgi:hypothetical protein